MMSLEYFEELAYLNCRSVSLKGAVKRMAVDVIHEVSPEAQLTSAARLSHCEDQVLRLRENGNRYDLDLRTMTIQNQKDTAVPQVCAPA